MLKSAQSVKFDTTVLVREQSNSSRRKLESESSSMSKPHILEQNEWIKEKLSKLWGENQADYFVNPTRIIQKKDQDNENDRSRNSSLANKFKTTRGLYAYAIWDSMRDDTNDRLKPFDLDKELQETMDSFLRNTKMKAKHNKENDDTEINSADANSQEAMNKLKKITNAARIKQAKIFRSEVELMYRSSKLNEQRVNIMRTNSPLPNVNDNEGKESIIRYLPPINLNEDNKTPKVNSTLEFLSSPTMRHKYKRELEKKLAQQNESTLYSLVEYKGEKIKGKPIEPQNVRLHFLAERPYKDYQYNYAKHEKSESQLSLETSRVEENKETAIEIYDDKNENNVANYPPLSINALMEYKPLIKAPGYGEFEHGKPKFFKLK